MIHELDATLEKLIYENGRIARRDVDIGFDIPTSEWSAKLSKPTINVWAFDLRENLRLRNADPMANYNRSAHNARMSLPPRRYDICYLVTAWARKVEDEHQLLWRTLGTLMQTPIIKPADCEGTLKDQQYDIPLTVANTPEHGVNFTDLWSVLNNQMRLGFTLIVTLALDTGRGFDSPLVFERRLQFGQSEAPEEQTLSAREPLIAPKSDRKSKREG